MPAVRAAARSPSTFSTKFKSWGLEASIEPVRGSAPYPVERTLELVEPERVVAALEGAAGRG